MTEEEARVEELVAELRGRSEAEIDAVLADQPWLAAHEMEEIIDRALVRHDAPEAEAKGVHTVYPLTDEIAGGSARAGPAMEPALGGFASSAARRRLSDHYRAPLLAQR